MSIFHLNLFNSAASFIIMGMFVAPVYADDVEDSVKEAMEYYKKGEFKEAADNLKYATQLIQQKRGNDLASILPGPLKGWKAEDASSQAAEAAMFGGGIAAEREYLKGKSRVRIQVLTDSPMMQSMMMMFSNPMFATADGGKLERIAGQKAIVKHDNKSGDGEISIVVANRFLVQIEGQEVSRDDLKAYAKAIDYKKLKAMP